MENVISALHEADEVENTEYIFGQADKYLIAFYVAKDGNTVPLAFTDNAIKVAANTALSNLEDIGTKGEVVKKSFFERFFLG